MTGLAGKIDVQVGWNDGHVTSVIVENSRPAGVTRLFKGKTYPQVLQLIPMLYSVCGVAQQLTAIEAVESALQQPVSEVNYKARQQLLMAENIRELGLRLARFWLDDQQLARQIMQWFVQVRETLQGCLQVAPTGCTVLPTGFMNTLNSMLPKPEAMQQCVEQLDRDYGDILLNPGARAMPELHSPAMMQVLPEIERALCEKPDFPQRPKLAGECFETGTTVCRKCDNGAVENLTQRFLRLIDSLASLEQKLKQPGEHVWRNHTGMAAVDAARGLLIHRVSLRGEIIEDYQIVAPTEWNFHSQGTLKQMLQGIPVEYDRLEGLVNKLVVLVDPCVDWSVRIGKDHA